MQSNFNDFLNDCNLKFTNEYYEKYKNGFSNMLTVYNQSFNPNNNERLIVMYELEKLTSSVVINLSNEIALNHLKDYHEWLTTNFDIKPKLT